MDQQSNSTILVVDDVPENITVLAGMLRSEYRVICATRGDDALQIVQQRPVDLILLDVMMPDMDGYEVCRRLKANLITREIPVIFVTALTEPREEAFGLELGAVDYLQKPCHDSIVRLRVQMHIERRNNNLALERLVRERTADLEGTRLEIIRRLGRAAEYRDYETGMHEIRIGSMVRLLSRAVGLSEKQGELLENAALMHDIGKIGIADAVLLKPDRLSPEEFEIIKTHTTIGAEIIGDHSSELMKMARTVALSHHEKWDGSGYPFGLVGEQIPLESRIVAIVDVFDALCSKRPYKNPLSIDQALAVMHDESARHFDPRLLSSFFSVVPEIIRIHSMYADPGMICSVTQSDS